MPETTTMEFPARALEQLREALQRMTEDPELAQIEAGRDAVYERYGRPHGAFMPDSLGQLPAETFQSFLRFENNRHWTGLYRSGGRTTADMPLLRKALRLLLDDTQPPAERFDEATAMVYGLGKAVATPILHVVYPERYGVWNSKSEAGLAELGLLPDWRRGATIGQKYELINNVLVGLAAALNTNLWSLDTAWEWLAKRQALAAPFNTIFADREQAEWAFDFFAETVERLDSSLSDERFGLTLPGDNTVMRLNFGQWLVADISNSKGTVGLALFKDRARQLGFEAESDGFAHDNSVDVFWLPIDTVRHMSDELRVLYEDSMAHINGLFSGWRGSPRRRSHRPELFEALFDDSARARLLSGGLNAAVKADLAFQGFTADAFAFMTELEQNNNTAWMERNRDRWRNSVQEPMRALLTDVGRILKPQFDPYLEGDTLETRVKVGKVLASIQKNWTRTPDSAYYPYYWGSYYRETMSKQSDAQLFINILPTMLRFGFSIGENAAELQKRFRQRVLEDPTYFFSLINRKGRPTGLSFVIADVAKVRETVRVESPEELEYWLSAFDSDIILQLTPEQTVARGPALVDDAIDFLKFVFPFYLLAILDEPRPVIETYLNPEAAIDDGQEGEVIVDRFDMADFCRETHFDEEAAQELYDALIEKGQIVLYGPPGTGKTYVANRLAKWIIGEKDPGREQLTLVQFHPAYAYEDFVEGIRPQSVQGPDGSRVDYPVRPGTFREFCDKARTLQEPCVLIVDEINRGNIPRIFGELMYLLEYRGQHPVRLPYSGDAFTIPKNVYIIGTMNTADRSIALVDFALRRRFQFIHFAAAPDLYDRWLRANPIPAVPGIGRLYRALATEAIDDEDFRIGPSYFMDTSLTMPKLRRIWRHNIMPLLHEYYLDQPERVSRWAWDGAYVQGLLSNGAAADDDGAIGDDANE